LRIPKAGAWRRVRRLERMPDLFGLVGERPAGGAEEVMLALTLVVMVGV
jgi:hypothetical protein